MNRDTFLERKNKKKSWEQTDYAFKTFLAHLERLKKAPADKQDALVEDCAFFLAFAGRLVLQGVEIIYKETTGHLRERLFEAVAKTEKDEVPWAMARVWSFHNPNPGTFLWRYTQELLSSDTEGRYVAQVGEKAKRLLATCNEKNILALKDFSFPNSNLIPEIINTSYDEEFLQDIDQLSSRDFRVSLVNVLNYGHEEKELKRKHFGQILQRQWVLMPVKHSKALGSHKKPSRHGEKHPSCCLDCKASTKDGISHGHGTQKTPKH